MPNAYDDLLQPQSADTSAPKANAYADLIPTETGEARKPAVETPSIGSQLERGAGLTGRALIQGVTGLPGMVADVGHSAYELATDPQARSQTWEQMKHPSQWLNMPQNAPSQQFSHAMDPYLPQPQTAAEKVMSAGLGAEAGSLAPQVPVPGAAAPEGFTGTAQVAQALRSAKIKAAQDAGFVVPPSTTNPTAWNKMREAFGGKVAVQQGAQAGNEQARNAAVAQDLGLDPDLLTPTSVAAVKREAGTVFQQARGIPRFNADEEYGTDLDKVLSQNRGANADFPGASNPDVEKLVETYRQPSMTGNSAVSAVQLLRQKANDAYRNGQSELGAAYKGISGAIERQTERGALSLEQKPDPQQFSLDMGFANQGDVSSRQLFDKTVPTTHGPEGVNGPMVYDPQTSRWSIQPQTQIKTVQEARQFGPAQQTGLPFSTRGPETFGPQPQAAPTGQYSTLVDALRKARTTYAKASTAEDAIDPMGNISGPKLAAAWNRDEPLSGRTRQAAEFAASFPKANLPANSSPVSHLSTAYHSIGLSEALGALAMGEPKAAIAGAGIAAIPAARRLTANYLLGPGQGAALPALGSKTAALAKALSKPTVMAGAYDQNR